jgi:transposase
MDLGKNKSVVCDYDSEKGTHQFETIRMTPQTVHDLLVTKEPDRVVIETGRGSGWVYDLAVALGLPVQVANTNHEIWRWRLNTKKNDRQDALKLAQLSALGQLPTVHMPIKKVRAWRSLIAYRQSLVERRTAIKNSIRALLEREGRAWPEGKSGWSQAALAELQALARSWPEATAEGLWRGQLGTELTLLAEAEKALAAVTEKLDQMGARQKPVRLLQTAAGVGPRLAEAVVASLDDPHRFKTGKQVGSYVGLTPRQYQSGQQDRKGHISGRGNATLRALLVEVSWLMLRWNDWARVTYRRLLERCGGRKKVAIVALARKLLVRLWALWRDGRPWSEAAAVT